MLEEAIIKMHEHRTGASSYALAMTSIREKYFHFMNLLFQKKNISDHDYIWM